jgi:2-iminobutanoate/2-iminopropanoate deaminase
MTARCRSAARYCIAAIVGVVLVPLSARGQAAPKQVIGTSTATLSPAVRVGDLVFTSGQLGVSRTAPDSTIQGQTKMALDNVKTVLEQAGTSMANVVKCTVFLVDLKDFAGMNQSYSSAFPNDPPARSTVVVAALVSAAAKIEVECIAAMPKP